MAGSGGKVVQAKLVLLGDMGAGKTNLALRFIRGWFFERQEPTVGAAYFTQTLSLNEATIKFDVWDTAGQERYHSLAPMYYRNATATLLVYESQIREPDSRLSLVGNKADLEAEREVATEETGNLSQEDGLFFMETSAKTSHNINELFYKIAKRVAEVCPQQPSDTDLQNESRNRRIPCCSG